MEEHLIEKRVASVIKELPPTVLLVGAVKMRTVEEGANMVRIGSKLFEK